MSKWAERVAQMERGAGWWQRPLLRFVRWFLDHLYTDLAWAYDLVANVTSMGQWWTWQRALDEALPSGPLLELGAGTGRLLRRYLTEGRHVIALDRSTQMVSITSRRLRTASLPLRIVQASATALPFKPAAFQTAYATFPSDYILEPVTLSEALRVLAEDGEIIVLAGAWIAGDRPLDRLARLLYQLTGQSPPSDFGWLEELDLPGVQFEWRVVEQPRARVLRLHLRPRAAPDQMGPN